MRDNSLQSLDRELGGYLQMIRRCVRRDAEGLGESVSGWMKFAAATGASLVGATSIDAAITHVVPPSPIRVNVTDGIAVGIDLDGDLTHDVALGAQQFVSSYGGAFAASLWGLGDFAVQVGSFFESGPDLRYGVVRYGAGQMVTPAYGGRGSVLRLSSTVFGSPAGYPQGQWGLDDTAYAGFIDSVIGTPRAGWIKVRTDGSGGKLEAVEVLEWAFQTVPGVSIQAGQTSSGSVPGDYNNNGAVGPEDYTIWKNSFGNNVTAGTGADGNSNGKVDAADYTVWRDHQTVFGSAAAAAVPEPATVTLGVLALGAAGLAALRRRAAQ